MKVPSFLKQDLTQRELIDFLSQVIRSINGGIEFGNASNKTVVNINGAWATGITPNPINTDFTLTHNLGRIPTGWIPVWTDGYVNFKIGVGVWNTKQIFLQANTVGVNYRIFVF